MRLLQEQNELIKSQNNAAQQKELSYRSAASWLGTFEPTFRPEAAQWHKQYKKQVESYFSHIELRKKYMMIHDSGDLMRQFSEESKRKWQFVKSYAATASHLDWEETPENMGEYNID